MFLKRSKSHNKVYLSFVQGYRDEFGKIKHKTIEKLGFLDDLKQQYDDPISHFKAIAKQHSNDEIKEYTIKNLNTKIIDEEISRKNFGYVILKKIYNELNLPSFFLQKEKNLKIEYSLNDIFELLVYSRILFPDSKLSTYNNKDVFFERFNFSIDDTYRSLNHFCKYKDELLTTLWNSTKASYHRDTSISYYDTTN